MVARTIDAIHAKSLKQAADVRFCVGDTVRIHVKIREGDKERIQIFTGTVIARKGHAATEMFTVRRVSHGVGVERVFPVHSPYVARIEVESSARVRRAKLYFLRQRSGKQTRLKMADEKPAAVKA
jgi:large subunit ribosomal protein L19